MRAYRLRRALAEYADEEAHVGALYVAACAVAVARERLGGLLPDAPYYPHRLRREELLYRAPVERHSEEPVRLALLGAYLRQEPVRRDAHRTSDAALLPHGRAQLLRERHRAAEEMRRAGHVEERLVDGDRLDERREAPEYLEHAVGRLRIRRHVRLHEYAVRAPLVGRAAGHRGVHAELARLVAARRDDAALVRPGPDYDGLAAPLRVVALLHGREERVHVCVHYDPLAHPPPRVESATSSAQRCAAEKTPA